MGQHLAEQPISLVALRVDPLEKLLACFRHREAAYGTFLTIRPAHSVHQTPYRQGCFFEVVLNRGGISVTRKGARACSVDLRLSRHIAEMVLAADRRAVQRAARDRRQSDGRAQPRDGRGDGPKARAARRDRHGRQGLPGPKDHLRPIGGGRRVNACWRSNSSRNFRLPSHRAWKLAPRSLCSHARY